MAGLFTSLFEAQNADNKLTTSKDIDEWLRFGGQKSTSGVNVSDKSAEGLAAFATVVRVLSNSLAHLPLILFERNGDDKRQARDNRLFQILYRRPNRWQTSLQWRKLKMRDLLFRGNAYSLIIGSTTNVQSLIRLHPDRVTPRQDSRTMEVTYDYSREDREPVEIPERQMLHIWFDSDDGIEGISPIRAHRQTIGDGIAVREHGSRFFANAARLSGVLKEPEGAKLGADARMALLADFESLYTGSENAHKTAILPGGVEFKEVSMSMEDAQWIEATKKTAREIYGIFGIPPHKAGDLADATFSNVENSNLDFVIDSLMPWLAAWEQALDKDLLDNDPGLFTKFNTAALLRGDFKSRQEALQIMRRNGIVNADEWRDLEDFNKRADDGGQTYLVEANMRKNDGNEGQDVEGGQ